tara:strand:+ start:184 stop:456 length:273 start_codon:yes stop_codon:yes gene_type:complete
MKNKILPFIKKYPMSILLAIIALNLFSIAGSLRESSKINRNIDICGKFLAYSRTDNDDKANKYLEKAKAKLGFTRWDQLTTYCYAIQVGK